MKVISYLIIVFLLFNKTTATESAHSFLGFYSSSDCTLVLSDYKMTPPFLRLNLIFKEGNKNKEINFIGEPETINNEIIVFGQRKTMAPAIYEIYDVQLTKVNTSNTYRLQWSQWKALFSNLQTPIPFTDYNYECENLIKK